MSTATTSPSPIRIIVSGAGGRMGARVCALAMEDARFALVGAVEQRGSPALGRHAAIRPGDAAPRITESASFSADFRADAVIDFSSDFGAHAAAELALRTGAALLVGTTALSESTSAALRDAAHRIAVLAAPNTSAGVAAAAILVERAARLLGPSFECAIVEAHHSAKRDAPSGTALRLAQAARAGGADLVDENIASIRAGDVIGEHTVRFAAHGEYIEITHRATTRDLFAHGALSATRWLVRQPPGWWTMNDVLGLPAR